MKKFIKRMFLSLLILIVALVVAVAGFLQLPKFGKLPSGERLERIKKSPNFKDGKFQNLSHTPDLTEGATIFGVMREFFFNKSKRNSPSDSIPSLKTDLLSLSPEKNVLIWFGHSSYFIQVDGKKILVDPVLSGSASPIAFTTRSFPGSDVYTAEEIPEIDYLLLSHDHWDHVDHETLLNLKSKVKTIITGLGTGEHLEYWGYEKEKIIEKDWYEEVKLDSGFTVNVTPARHFSGRGITRNMALWTSFVVTTPTKNIYIGGDSGYDSHFKEIGNLYGPFDLVLLECGQYDKSWKYIHMMPEEVVKAAEDLKAKSLMPVHWSKFALGIHAWDDPILRVVKASENTDLKLVYPLIGATLSLEEISTPVKWWVDLK